MSDNREIVQNKLPVVALVGRVNVGKSTLFNRLTAEQKALVSDIPGTTRTNNEGSVTWRGKQFQVIDTGGLTFDESVPLEEDIIEQSQKAIKKADVVVFVTDAASGILPQEYELARRLQKIQNKPVILVANKSDNPRTESNIYSKEWMKLGFGTPIPVSANSGRNLGDFLDHLYTVLKKISKNPKVEKIKEDVIKISIIGKPNVGKSSLFNKIIGEDKVIVNDMAHTTREPHDTYMEYEYKQGSKTKKQIFCFVDTAGIRRKSKVDGVLERQGITKSIESLEKSDIILFVLDGSEPLSQQDMQLAGLMERRSKSVIIILNKWDLSEDTTDAKRNEIKDMIYAHFPFLSFAPIVFTSGKTGYRVHQIFPLLMHAHQARHTEIPDETLREFMVQVTREHRPARGKGTRHPEIKGFKQIAMAPPIFEMFIKHRTSVHRSYVHYVENRIREQFDFFATPIVIKLTKMKR